MRCTGKLLSTLSTLVLLLLAAIGFAPAQQNTASARKISAIPYARDQPHSGPAWFVNVAARARLHMENVNGGADSKKYIIETTGSGVAIFDYDNDGWPDIFLVNGTS
jgi:hypothetical protein